MQGLSAWMRGWHRRCCAAALTDLAEAKPERAVYAIVSKGLVFLAAGCTHLSGTEAVPAVGQSAEALPDLCQAAAPTPFHM